VAVRGRRGGMWRCMSGSRGWFARSAGPLRPRQVCEALGMGSEARFIEAMRPKLTRLVADGVLAQVGPGLFATVEAAG
jgi:hypothetical protein